MVRLTPEAYEALTGLGKKNESYSELVTRLVEHYKKTVNHRK
jgi:predicted CopG family antitoxin